MAGSISLSLTQRYDKTTHVPLDGGQVTFYAAGTTTPQSAYQDISLTIPWPNPLTLDSGGNVPQLFFADGYIKFRLANSDGVTQIEADFVLVLGPTSGAGAAPSVDPTTIMQTGHIELFYGTGVLTGFVRANSRTIGSAASGASERANADTAPLYSFLYNADANLVVSGGRGVSAAADFAANKTIATPDFRSRALAGLGDMGNSDNALFSGATFTSGNSTTLGSLLGAARRTLAANNLPATSPWSVGITDTTAYSFTIGNASTASTGPGIFVNGVAPSGLGGGTIIPVKTGTVTATPGTNSGGGAAFDSVSTYALVTLYLKL